MAVITPQVSRAMIDGAKLPKIARRTRGPLDDRPPVELRDTDPQTLVAGSGLIVAAENVPAQTREDIVNCTLFAQLAASGAVPDAKKVVEWYEHYFHWLKTLGWVQSEQEFQDYRFSGQHAEAHKAVEKVLVALLGPQAAALVVVQAALAGLQEMAENSPWLTVFERQSRVEKSARFQLATAQVGGGGLLETALAAFDLRAKSTFTQVLFFKFSSSSTKLKYAAGRATIYEAALASERTRIAERLAEYRRQMVGEVTLAPLPGPATRGLRRKAPAAPRKFKPGDVLLEL